MTASSSGIVCWYLRRVCALALLAILAAGCSRNPESADAAAAGKAGEWTAHGRTPSEQRFSPLTQIDIDQFDVNIRLSDRLHFAPKSASGKILRRVLVETDRAKSAAS